MSCRALVCLLLAASSLSAEWMAGASRVSITPREPVWLSGYAGRDRPHEKVIQEIFVKALALRDESGATSVIVTSDLVGLSVSMVDSIRQRATRESGIAAERLILNYSHNHSAPVTGDVLHLYYDLDTAQKAAVERYTRTLLDRYQQAIAEAVRNLAPATLAFEQGLAGFAVNRRRARPGGRGLYGPVDHDVPVLSVRAPDGRLRAVLFGYACHNTALGRYEVSGDYAGYAQEALEKAWPGAVALFLMGAGGDANPLPRYQGTDPALGNLATDLASMYGRILAASVDLVLRGTMRPVHGPLRTALGKAEAPFQKAPTAEELRAQLADAKAPMRRREIQHLLGVLEREGRLPDRYPYPVQVWQFGEDLKLIALTGEPVVDYALRFKKRYGQENTWVAGYTNELLAYIPSLRVLKEGGYEGTEGMAEYGLPAPFGEGVEEAIASKVDELAQATGSARSYFEGFDGGSGGWVANRYHTLPVFDGVAYCHGPWYLDSHHAPPGAGYLHMLMYLYTKAGSLPADHIGRKGNAFLDRKMSTNLLNARLTARVRGRMEMQGAQMVLLVQAATHGTVANFVLTGQPFQVTPEWSEQTVTLTPDPAQWTCLGARESMKQRYGCAPIDAVLRDVNVDIMFVLFPLKVVPAGDVKEPHKLRAGQDYPGEPSYEVQQKYLPSGLIMFDQVRIDYP